MATATIDVDYLSAYLGIPPETLNSLVVTPTPELVQAVLGAVALKARECDELAADKLRVDIELENAVRSSETRVEGLRASLEESQKTLEESRMKLKKAADAKSSLESQLQALKSSSATSTSEAETLRARISLLEASNRDTISVLESKTRANDELAKDLQKQHQKGLELSQQITTLQQTVQNSNSAASTAKFREQSLKQEVELAKRNNEWFENELKTKSAEALKYRKEKGSRIAELQRQNEDLSSNLEAAKRTEQALRTRLDELQKQYEDSLAKVQQLREAAANAEDGYRQELESSRRLAELQKQQAETKSNRLKDVEASLEKVKDDAADEVGRCQQEADDAHREADAYAENIAELNAEIDRLNTLLSQPRPGSIPGTPRQNLNGSMFGRSRSPAQFGTPGSVRSKSAITATQAIDELYKVKGQLTTEKRLNERLSADFDDLLSTAEAKASEIIEIQEEHQRLSQEIIEMSRFVDETGKERDRARKVSKRMESELSTAQAEINIQRSQLRDLSAQVKMLLAELDARERGLNALSPTERAQLERLARGEISEGSLEGLTDTDKLISQRLTVFRSISELQEKNEELLKLTRALSHRMESEEALAAKSQASQDHEKVHELEAKVENYKDELKSVITRSESYIKERDMFRRMLQHRGQMPADSEMNSMFGQSIDSTQNGILQSSEQTRDNANNAVLLRELQAQYDLYRNEQATDRRTLKDQAEKLSMEKGSLQAEISKINSQLTLTNERYELLNSNYMMLQNENVEMQKRTQILSESSAKQDLRTQQVAEDLIEAKGLVESMRNENSNLKAEKKLWKEIQDRLSQDNEGLVNERTRLNVLISDQQALQNERELSDSETRRRLQTQVDALEAELTTTKRKLSDEIEDGKKAQLRKEYDSQQNQKRIDDLASSLSQVREELVSTKTTRDHLQSRVDELTIELRSAEERLGLLQPRPTPRPGTEAADASNGDIQEGELSREQELAVEVSELKRDLELAKSELDSTKSQMEQYKSISQSSEEELESLNATQDQYREEMDLILAEKDTKLKDLQQRVDDISAELTNTNNELTTLRNQQSEVARQAEDQKAILQSEVARLRDEDERHATAAQYHQQDLRAQAAIATKAQQDYENELVKHAEAAQLLRTLRGEHNKLKTESATLRADAESARVALSQNEISWEERRERLEQELLEVKTRRDDLNAQNKLLHQQLEDVSGQVSALQQSRSALVDADNESSFAEASHDRTSEGLRELNSFLRREKEIVEVQYELKIQEAKRLQQQLDYSQSQLDESRLKLDQERRIHADGGRSSGAHKDLMDKLEELNLFRESSITLRNEARQAQTQLAEKTKRVEELIGQIQPLETRIRELEHGQETKEGEVKLLQEDRDRWQKRTESILSKYDRIDPAEMDALKASVESLTAERDALIADKLPLEDKINGLEAEKQAFQQTLQQTRTKLIEQAKERNRVNRVEISERIAERDAVTREKDAIQQELDTLQRQLDNSQEQEIIQQQLSGVQQELSGLQQELETAVREKNAAEQRLSALGQEFETVRSERDQALIAVSAATPAPTTPPLAVSAPIASPPASDPALEQQLTDLRTRLDQVTQERQSLKVQLSDLREQLDKANSDRDSAITQAAEAKAKASSAFDVNAEIGVEEGQIEENATPSISDEERKSLEERIVTAEAKAKEQEDKAARIEAEMETTVKQRSDKMKAALNKKLTELKEVQKAELDAEFKLKFEQEKQIWLAENKTTMPNTPVKVIAPPPKGQDEAAVGAPATPATPIPESSDKAPPEALQMTDMQVKDLLSRHPTGKSIISMNVKTRLATEVQKAKDEHAAVLAELQQKAESSKTQAVMMETKKSALRINMSENKVKIATGKLEVVEKAAQETPQKAVVEVWEVVKAWKPAPPAPAAPASTAAIAAPAAPTAAAVQPNRAPATLSKPTEVKTESDVTQAPPQPSSIPLVPAAPSALVVPSAVPNGAAAMPPQPGNSPLSNIPVPGSFNNSQRNSSIPMPGGRGGAMPRGRGGGQQMYQRGGGQNGRGRGGAQNPGRGGMNAGAQPFSPNGQGVGVGVKRTREEGSFGGQNQGHPGKRPRGGGPN